MSTDVCFCVDACLLTRCSSGRRRKREATMMSCLDLHRGKHQLRLPEMRMLLELFSSFVPAVTGVEGVRD